MSTTTANVDYVSTVFQYPVLTKVHDTPTYDLLKRIKDELKANAGNVQCDLGGDRHGHLGLVLSPEEYASISATAYVRPVHPGATYPVGATNYATQILRENHQEAIRLYREANGVEDALIGQLTQALPPLYLESYRDPHSNRITAPLITILADLFTTYGSISEEELEEKEQALRARVFDITRPLLHVFSAIENLQQVALASGTPYTVKQRINIGLYLIKNMGEFEKGLSSWYERPSTDHTWPIFKQHFNDTYNRLRRL